MWLVRLLPLSVQAWIGGAIGTMLFWLIPGTDGPNRFGAPPPPNTTGTIVLALILPLVFVVGIVAAVAIPAYQTYAQRAQMHQQ